MKKNLISSAVTLALLGSLSGCGSDQDQGSVSSSNVEGKVVDGYVAYALAFIDTNNDNQLNAWEPRALTDSDGYFTTSKDGLNYCALPEESKRRIYCLSSTAEVPSGTTLRFVGGYDISTGEPFVGTLSTTVAKSADGQIQPRVSTPITSLLVKNRDTVRILLEENDPNITEQEIKTIQDQVISLFATHHNFTVDQLESDFYAEVQENDPNTPLSEIDARLMALALKLHKAADILADAVEDINPEKFGSDPDFPDNATGAVYDALFWAWYHSVNENPNIDYTIGNLLSETTNNDEVLNFAYYLQYYALNNRVFNALISETEAHPTLVAAFQRAAQLNTLIDNKISAGANLSEVNAIARSVEIMTAQARKADPAYNMSGDFAAVEQLMNDSNFIDAMGTDGVDVAAISNNFNSSTLSTSTIQAATRQTPYPDLAGATTKFSANQGQDQIQLYFHRPDSETPSFGDLSTCVKYTSKGESSSYYTSGSLFRGTWELLDDFTLLFTMEIVGGTESMIAKLISSQPVSNGIEWTYSFDFNDELSEWTGVTTGDAFATYSETDLPINSESCLF